jgi:hypothetical protein
MILTFMLEQVLVDDKEAEKLRAHLAGIALNASTPLFATHAVTTECESKNEIVNTMLHLHFFSQRVA